MKWLSPRDIIAELTELYPVYGHASHGFLPVGECLEGTGDAFLVQTESAEMPIVRIPHGGCRPVKFSTFHR